MTDYVRLVVININVALAISALGAYTRAWVRHSSFKRINGYLKHTGYVMVNITIVTYPLT